VEDGFGVGLSAVEGSELVLAACLETSSGKGLSSFVDGFDAGLSAAGGPEVVLSVG
jgi:hypothetical protein